MLYVSQAKRQGVGTSRRDKIMRKAGGYFLMVIFIAIYVVAVVMLGEAILGASQIWSLLFYAAAGIGVVYPCIKILDWSHKRGKSD